MQGDPLVRPVRMSSGSGLIAWVAQDGMSGLGKVNADLISPPGFQPDFDQRRVGQVLQNAIVGHRQLADLAIEGRVAIEGFVRRQIASELALRGSRPARDDRHVLPPGLSRGELIS